MIKFKDTPYGKNEIIINGEIIILDPQPGIFSYERIVELAGMSGYPSITYKGPDLNGILIPGENIEMWNDMVFNVAHTGNA